MAIFWPKAVAVAQISQQNSHFLNKEKINGRMSICDNDTLNKKLNVEKIGINGKDGYT